MSLAAIAYLVGMGLVFIGERLVDAAGLARWLLDGLGLVALVGAIGVQLRRSRSEDDAGRRRGFRITAILAAVGVASLGLYFLSGSSVGESLGFGDPGRWSTILQALWPAVWVVGTGAMLVVDRALTNSPVVAPRGRIDQALQHGLAAAMGLAVLFPINYLADRHHKRWDLAYFETAAPGSATRKAVDTATQPVHVYAFLPPASEVVEEVRGYFEALEGPKLTYRRVDQTAHPQLARELRVRRNGTIAVTTRTPEELERAADDSDAPDQPDDSEQARRQSATQRIKIGMRLEQAKSKLENLDAEFQQRVLAVAHGQRVAYLTRGHGELTSGGATEIRRIQTFQTLLESLNFDVKSLGLNEGLAEGVPDDADMVVILGPNREFLDEEVAALRRYRDRGGSLLVGLEPDFSRSKYGTLESDDPLREFLGEMGVELGEGVLAAETGIVPSSQGRADRVKIHTNRFTSHPSTATLAGASERMVLITPVAGWWNLDPQNRENLKATVRSRSSVWSDLDSDLTFDPDAGEEKRSRPIVVAAHGEVDGDATSDASSETTDGPASDRSEWRALLVSNASLFSDAVARNAGNDQFIREAANWLAHTGSVSGDVRSQEDVRIRHTKKGQALWFWGPVGAVPLLVLSLGGLHVWRRRQGGES